MVLSLSMAGIARAVPVLVAGIATPGMATVSAADAASASTAVSQAFPFASARRIVIVTAITTGDATAMATGATGDNEKGAGDIPLFLLSRADADEAAP
jgi:hypothetical protein